MLIFAIKVPRQQEVHPSPFQDGDHGENPPHYNVTPTQLFTRSPPTLRHRHTTPNVSSHNWVSSQHPSSAVALSRGNTLRINEIANSTWQSRKSSSQKASEVFWPSPSRHTTHNVSSNNWVSPQRPSSTVAPLRVNTRRSNEIAK